MSNKYKQHILALPEDDANRQIANGFLLNPHLNIRTLRILPPSGGWSKALDLFKKRYLSGMRSCEKRMFLFLIDFDGDENRLKKIHDEIPDDLRDRVFALGSGSDPEALKRQSHFNSLEEIGKALAEDCVHNCVHEMDSTWGHPLLRHNKIELERLITDVKPFVFSDRNPNG